MTSYVIESPERVSLSVAGTSDRFPVRRVYCIGQNYAAHVIEMGNDPSRQAPFFFQKNADCLDGSGEFPYPPKTSDVHHEVEMAVMLKTGGSNIPEESALEHVYGYATALDMTRRDLQAEQKKAGRPWEIAKAFDRSAPIGLIHSVDEIGHPTDAAIQLSINGQLKQQGNLNQMIWKVPEIISYLSNYFKLAPGDVILSGTPSGVGPVQTGDLIVAGIDGLNDLTVRVA